MPQQPKNRNVVVVDPEIAMDRFLKYGEKHAGWNMFRAFYWSLYLIILGIMLIYWTQIGLTATMFFGVALIIFATMLILYGLTHGLHHQFIRRFG